MKAYQRISLELRDNLGGNSPAYSTVARWCAEYTRGRTTTEGDLHSGRPTTVVTEETVKKNVKEDHHVTLCFMTGKTKNFNRSCA
ncbi:hypothetical protein EVAR_52669_1 [Eumeta japonica]|uniref:Mos1 transposase HTH domain-containing protein n=1 Tax=Eumeta variegata TaxID=151549 RepID=A0A4C1ZMQ7_EUMVA|nr:hypothetical protein EVAR_52669_1 [Eumeta japonica]